MRDKLGEYGNQQNLGGMLGWPFYPNFDEVCGGGSSGDTDPSDKYCMDNMRVRFSQTRCIPQGDMCSYRNTGNYVSGHPTGYADDHDHDSWACSAGSGWAVGIGD